MLVINMERHFVQASASRFRRIRAQCGFFFGRNSVVLVGCHLLVFNPLYAVLHVNPQSLANEETLNGANTLRSSAR